MGAKLVLSFDFELGWGVADSDVWKHREKAGIYSSLRPRLHELFKLLEDWQLPTTWAVVGGLLAESEDDLDLDHLPPAFAKSIKTFFSEASLETRCAVDLFDGMGRIMPFTEIGSHTMTHVYAGVAGADAVTYARDIDLSCDIIEARVGGHVDSIVFPRDQIDFQRKVSSERLCNIRINPAVLKETGKRGKLARVRELLSVPPSSVILSAENQIFQSGSLFFSYPLGKGSKLRSAALQVKKSILLKKLADGDGLFHVWLHPFNLALSDAHWNLFSSFLQDVELLRQKGEVEVITMRAIGNIIRQGMN